MTLQHRSRNHVRAAAVPLYTQYSETDRQKRELLPRVDARSGGALCTDAMKPVLFKVERVKEV